MQSTIRRLPPGTLRGLEQVDLRWGHALILGLLAAAMLLTVVLPDHADTIGPLGAMIGYGSAGYILLGKARPMEGREKRAWLLVGIGFLLAASGIFLVAMIQTIAGSVPAFGPTDTVFILVYALILSGLVSLPHFPISMSQRLRVYLDSLIGAVSLGVIMWVIALGDLVHEFASASAWDRWAGTAYPVADVAALMVVIIVSVRRSSFRFDPRLLLFAMGIILQSVADLRFLTTGIGKSFADAQPNYTVFLLATTLYLAAAIIADRQPKARTYAERHTSIWATLAPYSVASAMIVLLIVKTSTDGLPAMTEALLIGTYFVGALVVVRQAIAIRENRQLVERQRTDLVSSISHELRTPLTAIVGFLDVLADKETGIEETERIELAEVTREQAHHMAGIVSDLILLARGSPDELTLKESPVVVADVVKKAVNSVERKSTSLTIEVEAHLQAMIDAGRVQQVMVNLLTNAVRYGEGKSLIVVRREGNDLAIEVHDNGPGVPKRFELAIWQRFERGVNRLNSNTPGSGVGLAVVDAITKAHGGDTGYRPSERLGGACFRVVLPERVTVA